MPSSYIPTISLADTGRQQLSSAILDACTGPGFFYLTDIPIDTRLIDSAWKASEELFLDDSDTAMQAKRATMNRAGNTGYTAIQEEKLASYPKNGEKPVLSSGDLKESFYIARLAESTPRQRLPQALTSHETDLEELFEGCKRVCTTVITAFEQALGLEPNFFTSCHHAIDDRLRLIHYPPIPYDETNPSTSTTEIRAGSHSDYGTITLLFQRGVSGLQVLGKGGEDDWIDIPPKQGAIVVNVGDALEFWTSAIFSSTQHRVVMPRNKEEAVSRFSMAYFCQPDPDALLQPLTDIKTTKDIPKPSRADYEEVLRRKGIDVNVERLTGGQHLQQRLKSTYVGLKGGLCLIVKGNNLNFDRNEEDNGH